MFIDYNYGMVANELTKDSFQLIQDDRNPGYVLPGDSGGALIFGLNEHQTDQTRLIGVIKSALALKNLVYSRDDASKPIYLQHMSTAVPSFAFEDFIRENVAFYR